MTVMTKKSPADHLWMHFTRMSTYADHPVPTIERGEGAYIWDTNGRKYLDALVRAVRGPSRARPGRDGRGDGRAGPQTCLLPGVVLRPPDRGGTRRPAGRRGPRRPEQGLLLHRRRRERGDRLQGGQAVLQADRQAVQDQGHLPGDRLPRHHAGSVVDHQRAGVQARLRAVAPGDVPGAEHQLLPGAARVRARREAVRLVGGQPGRGDHPRRGTGVGGRGLRRAGTERRRLHPAAARVLRAAARDLRHV